MIGTTCHNMGHPPNSKPPGPQPPMEKAHRVRRNVVGRGFFNAKLDCSYGPLPVISTYNPIYKMYNPTYNQL